MFVAKGAPRYHQGHLLAKELVIRGLQTTLITESEVFAMISMQTWLYLQHLLSWPVAVLQYISTYWVQAFRTRSGGTLDPGQDKKFNLDGLSISMDDQRLHQ